MVDIYQWLYDHYALPELQDIAEEHEEVLTAFTERIGASPKERLRLHDMVSNMRLEWGTEVFILGVQLGIQINTPRPQAREPGWLMHFLP